LKLKQACFFPLLQRYLKKVLAAVMGDHTDAQKTKAHIIYTQL
jgi:hypothetical protein